MVSFCHLKEVTHICTTAFPWYFYSCFTQLNVYLNAFSPEAVVSLKVWDYTFCLRASFPNGHRWLCQCHSHTCSAVVALAYRWALCLIWTFLELIPRQYSLQIISSLDHFTQVGVRMCFMGSACSPKNSKHLLGSDKGNIFLSLIKSFLRFIFPVLYLYSPILGLLFSLC